MYGAFIGNRVQRSNGMLEASTWRNIWRLFYDSFNQSCWQYVQLLHEKERNRQEKYGKNILYEQNY